MNGKSHLLNKRLRCPVRKPSADRELKGYRQIQSKEDFDKFCTYFLSNHNYRDYALFIVGIELGTLRSCDLLKLRIKDVYNGKEFRDTVYGVVEQKTGKIKNVYIPDGAKTALKLYLSHRCVQQRKSAFRTAGKRDFEQGSKGNWRHLSGCHAHPAQDMGLPHLHQPQKRQHGPDGHHEKLQPFCPRHHAALYRHGRGAPKRNVHGV